MRCPGLIGMALGLLAGAASGSRNAASEPTQRVVTEDETPAASPAATEAMVAVNRAPVRAAKPQSVVCGEGMALVEGKYCPNVRLNCKKYLDPKGAYENFRCAEYGPSTCLSNE